MLYLERRPHPALAPFLKSFCDAFHHPPPPPPQPTPAALLLGISSHHQQIDAIDLSELIGILFHPGGTTPFFPENTQLFTNCETDLTTLWGRAAQNLRNDLREAQPPARKFDLLDFALRHRLSETKESKTHRRPSPIDYALTRLHQSPGTTTITALTRDIGVSPPPL